MVSHQGLDLLLCLWHVGLMVPLLQSDSIDVLLLLHLLDLLGIQPYIHGMDRVVVVCPLVFVDKLVDCMLFVTHHIAL